jgi:long-chain acyl-CoA synthetase
MAIARPEPRGHPGNLGLLFAEHAGSDRPALIDLRDPGRPRPVSFRELDAGCNAVARGLARAGLKPGGRVGILSLNRGEFVMTLLGAMRAGMVPVPVNVKLPADAAAYILNDAGARIAFAEAGTRRLIPPGLRVVEFGGEFEQFLDTGSFKAFEPGPDSVAIQPYTSGSTGRPKGVLLTHYGQNWSRRILAHTRGTTERDVILVAAPLYHKNALNAIKQGLTAGATLPLLPQFAIERYIEAIGRYHCTVISGVPTMMAMLLTRKDLLARTDTTSVRTIMMGSAPSSPQLIKDLHAQFPNAEPLVVYGVTEGGPVPLGPHPEGKPRPIGSLGVPYPGTEAKLVPFQPPSDTEGFPGSARRALQSQADDPRKVGSALVGGPGPDEGELALMNPGNLLGYHNLPDETAKRLRDGWYYTGDVCRRDADGFYWFVGRTDDMFVSGGENIFPGEVEALLQRHPAVHQALVMPFDHELKGQVPYAFVVPRSGVTVSEDELKQYALANGPAYQHPRRVFILDQLPLSGTNKVDREQLRRLVAGGATRQVTSDE